MAQVSKFSPFVRKWEGGFSNNPLDKGGATMAGITLATFQGYRKSKGLPEPTVEDLKKISDSEWNAIMKQNYWDKFQADKINSQAIANLLVGWAWGSGPVTAIKQFQKLAGLFQDGVVGAKTLSAINDADPKVLFNKIWLARKDFFIDICIRDKTQLVFLKGWLNRLYDNVDYCFNLAPK